MEDVSAPLRASMALAYDHAYIIMTIADVLKKEEKEMNKPLEIEPESMKVFVEEGKGTSIVLSAHDKENPSDNKIIKVPIDESKLSSKEMMDNLQKQAYAEESSTTNHINKGLAIYGVVTCFRGAIYKLEEGDYIEGSVYLSQSSHGLGDLTGINNKIWQASKQFMKRALQKPLDKLSKSVIVRKGEEFVETEISGFIGKVDLAVLDEIPIIRTAFGIYNIVEDFKQHNTLVYIDAGLDIAITGLLFMGPGVEPIIIPLIIIRMGMDTFYNDIGNEISSLPEDVSLIDKLVQCLKESKMQ